MEKVKWSWMETVRHFLSDFSPLCRGITLLTLEKYNLSHILINYQKVNIHQQYNTLKLYKLN